MTHYEKENGMAEKVNKPRVFVYGSLKRGEANHYLIEQGGGNYLGDAELSGPYMLRDFGWYPGVMRVYQGANTVVHGEVFEIDDELLAAMDLLEGHPNYYSRERLAAIGDYKNTWVYLLPEGYADVGTHLEGGKWPAEEAGGA